MYIVTMLATNCGGFFAVLFCSSYCQCPSTESCSLRVGQPLTSMLYNSGGGDPVLLPHHPHSGWLLHCLPQCGEVYSDEDDVLGRLAGAHCTCLDSCTCPRASSLPMVQGGLKGCCSQGCSDPEICLYCVFRKVLEYCPSSSPASCMSTLLYAKLTGADTTTPRLGATVYAAPHPA